MIQAWLSWGPRDDNDDSCHGGKLETDCNGNVSPCRVTGRSDGIR